MSDWHLAQINIARASADLDSPQLADFIDNIDRINALADRSPGFVWRFQTGSGGATDYQVTDDPRLILNLSVWETADALFDFVYRTAHAGIMARRREWFDRPTGAHQALFWVPAGHRPRPEEAMAKLALFDRVGPSRRAFTFKQRFPPPGESTADGAPEAQPAG